MSASILEGSSSYSSEHGKRRRPDSTSSESRPSVRQTLLQLVSHERVGHRNRFRPSGQKAIQRHSMQVSPQMMFINTAGTVARTASGHSRRVCELVWCKPTIGIAERTETLRSCATSSHCDHPGTRPFGEIGLVPKSLAAQTRSDFDILQPPLVLSGLTMTRERSA
jgi:hypothetical protein